MTYIQEFAQPASQLNGDRIAKMIANETATFAEYTMDSACNVHVDFMGKTARKLAPIVLKGFVVRQLECVISAAEKDFLGDTVKSLVQLIARSVNKRMEYVSWR